MFSKLVQYDSDSSGEENGNPAKSKASDPAKDAEPVDNKLSLQIVPKPDLCPTVDESMLVDYKRKAEKRAEIDPRKDKIIYYNPKYEDLYAPMFGPRFDDEEDEGKNFLTGHIEDAFVDEAQFEEQRKQFHRHGKALDPSDNSALSLVQRNLASTAIGSNVSDQEAGKKEKAEKRKRLRNDDPSDVDNFVGPWAEFEDEVKVSQPSEQEKEEIDQFMAKKKKVVYKKEAKEEEKSTLHIKDPYDYQGRSFLHPPHDLGVNLKYDHVPDKCFIPKKCLHTFTGHTNSVTAIRWFPVSAHLFLSCSMDSKIKLWEVYNERRNILTYHGHPKAVRDICFNRTGEQFVSCDYEKGLKLWDTEYGKCIRRFENRKMVYCVKFNTDADSSHLFLTGMRDKKILCWDCRTGAITQEYDRHLGPVNTINFVDDNRRFVSTSDDKVGLSSLLRSYYFLPLQADGLILN